jgi:hypothetical protein
MPVLRFVALAFAKTFSKIFGVATITFFGRIPSRDDDKVAFVGLLSLTWLALLVAVVIPSLAELVMPGLPEDETLIRTISAVLVVVIPPLNGVIITRLHNQDGGGRAVVRHLVLGFGYTAVIGGVVVAIVVVVPVVKASHILRRYELMSLAVMVPEGAYDEVLESIADLLKRYGVEAEIVDPNPVVGRLFHALAWVEGRIFCREHAAKQMKSVRGESDEGDPYEVILHATDVTIVGRQRESSHIYAILAEHLEHPGLYFTWDDDAQEVEDEIVRLRDRLGSGEAVSEDDVDRLREALRELQLAPEEWNALRRLLYRLEIERLHVMDEEPERVGSG